MAIYERPNSKYYWMKFTFEGELIQRSTKCSNKRDAKKVEAAYWHELAPGRIGIKPKKEIPTFAAVAKDFLEWSKVSHAEQSTVRRERFAVQLLADFFGKKRLMRLSQKMSKSLSFGEAIKFHKKPKTTFQEARSTGN